MIFPRQDPCQEPHLLGILLDALDVVNYTNKRLVSV